MFPNILSDRQQRSLIKQLENEKQTAAEFKRQAYALRKEHERSMVQQSLDRERQLEEINICSAMKYLDTLNTGSAKHNFKGIDEAADMFNLSPSTVRDHYKKHVASRIPSNPPTTTNLPPLNPSLISPPSLPLINNVSQSTDAKINDLVRRVIDKKIKGADAFRNNKSLLEDYGCPATFYNLIKRRKLDSNAPLRPEMGRGDRIDPMLIESIKSDSAKDYKGASTERVSSGQRNKMLVTSYDPAIDVPNSFQHEVKAKQLILNPTVVPRKLSDSSLRKLEKATKESTKTTTDNGSQNRRRYQALNDAYNSISRIVMTEVLLRTVGNVIDPRLMFNTDSSSHFLNADAEMTLLTSPGVVDDLNNQNRNPTKTKTGKEDQRRSICYTPIINNAGEICAMTTNIKDHSFNGDGKVKTYKVSDKVYIQTIPTGPKPSTSVNYPEIEVDDDVHDENDIVEMAAGQADAELYEESLLNNFARQAAYQYLNGVYLPVMLERRRKAIREDDYTKKGATLPISVSSSLSSDSCRIEYTLEEEAKFLRLESDPKTPLSVHLMVSEMDV